MIKTLWQVEQQKVFKHFWATCGLNSEQPMAAADSTSNIITHRLKGDLNF